MITYEFSDKENGGRTNRSSTLGMIILPCDFPHVSQSSFFEGLENRCLQDMGNNKLEVGTWARRRSTAGDQEIFLGAKILGAFEGMILVNACGLLDFGKGF